jgi:mannose-6-phosphate isomerase
MSTPDLGKTEAWYIIDAQPDSVLYAGLQLGVTRHDLAEAIRMGRTEECLHAIKPQAGDCIFIPSGTVHALGAGLLVAEIQQASDCTFRLFDWNRVDASGAARPLHIEQSLDVIDFDRGPVDRVVPKLDRASNSCELVACDKFRLVLLGESSVHLLDLPTCKIIAVPQGTATISTSSGDIELCAGQSALVPHACGQAKVIVAGQAPQNLCEKSR